MRRSDPVTVLVVDDEPFVRRVLEAALTHHGLRVLTAENGPAAVAAYREPGARVDVVLTDVRMPEMDGPAVLAALRAVDPGVRAVFMSGDTGGHAEADLTRGGARLVRKPFASLSDLAGVLRQVASESTPPG